MVDVRKEFQQVLYRAGYAASLDLKKKILNGEIRGNKYDKDLNESVCFIGTLASYLGVSSSDFAFSYGYIRNLQNPCESWFLGIVPGDTPRIHARLEFAVYWIDEVLNDIERLPDEWQYELFKRKQSREPKSILSAKV